MTESTVQTFSYRTASGCLVHGHKDLVTGEEHITLATEQAKLWTDLRVVPAYEMSAPAGRSWP